MRIACFALPGLHALPVKGHSFTGSPEISDFFSWGMGVEKNHDIDAKSCQYACTNDHGLGIGCILHKLMRANIVGLIDPNKKYDLFLQR